MQAKLRRITGVQFEVVKINIKTPEATEDGMNLCCYLFKSEVHIMFKIRPAYSHFTEKKVKPLMCFVSNNVIVKLILLSNFDSHH